MTSRSGSKQRRARSARLAALRESLHKTIDYQRGKSLIRARESRCARIVMYHGIDASGIPPRTFRRQITYLTTHFQVVPLRHVLSIAAGEEVANGREVALTFDDGLRNFVDSAYPALRTLGAPATVFICPTLIDEARWQWTHDARQRLLHVRDADRRGLMEACGLDGPYSVEAIVDSMKRLPFNHRTVVETEIRSRTQRFIPSSSERHAFDVASWAELRSLDPSLVEIGSHSASHALLTRLTATEVEQEVGEAASRIAAEIARPSVFSYPNGECDAQVEETVRRHHDAAVGVVPDFVRSGSALFALPRIAFSASMADAAWRMHSP
jgi:peptidoglycan/xylan/chitin deacetylase (PgdA/CDA1 family)